MCHMPHTCDEPTSQLPTDSKHFPHAVQRCWLQANNAHLVEPSDDQEWTWWASKVWCLGTNVDIECKHNVNSMFTTFQCWNRLTQLLQLMQTLQVTHMLVVLSYHAKVDEAHWGASSDTEGHGHPCNEFCQAVWEWPAEEARDDWWSQQVHGSQK